MPTEGFSVVAPFARKSAIEDVSDADFSAWASGIDTALIDCDGVLWKEADVIPGAPEAIAALRAAGKRVIFVTNNSTKSRTMYVEKLAGFGIEASLPEIMTSAYCVASYMRSEGFGTPLPPASGGAGDVSAASGASGAAASESSTGGAVDPAKRRVYVVGEQGLIDELTSAGVECTGMQDSLAEFDSATFTRERMDPTIGAVVAGFDKGISYHKMCVACSHIRYGGARLIITNRDLTFPATDMELPGGGVVIQCIELGSGTTAEFVGGKPDMSLLRQIVREHGIDLGRTVMIGDRLNTDIEFGNKGGTHTLLVMSGVTKESDLEAVSPDDAVHAPSLVAPTIAAFGERLTAVTPPAAPAGKGGETGDAAGPETS